MQKKYIISALSAVAVASSANAAVISVHTGALADTNQAAIDVSGWDVGETYYFQATITGAVNGGTVTGFGLDIGTFPTQAEQVFIGDGFGAGTPWAVFTAGGVNQGTSTTPTLDGSAYTVVLAATRGASNADNTFSLYIGANLSETEANNTATITGNLTTADLGNLTHVRAIVGTGSVSDIVLYTEGSTAFAPEPSSTALIGLGGLALILRRRK